MKSTTESNFIDWKYLVEHFNDPNIYLIDVRPKNNPNEKESIPRSINIPIDDLKEFLKENTTANKPKYTSKIIFFGSDSISGRKAVDIALEQNYNGCKYLKDGWQLGWKSHFLGNKGLISRMHKSNVFLIDLRSKKVIQENGTIPDSINIPFNHLENALNYSAFDFKRQLKCEKPRFVDELIFFSDKSEEAIKAISIAWKSKYSSATYYFEGWAGWKKYFVCIQDVKDFLNDYLIDLRAHATDGLISKSINIIYADLETTFLYSDEYFQTKFGKSKPQKDQIILFFAKDNNISVKALETVQMLGYTNSKCFYGNLSEYFRHNTIERIYDTTNQQNRDDIMFS